MPDLNKPVYKKTAQLLIDDELTQPQIANMMNISQPSVSRVKNEPAVRAIIDKITLDSINELAPTIYDNRKSRINLANQAIKYLQSPIDSPLPEGFTKDDAFKIQELAQKDEVKIEQNIGIAPTHSLPLAVQNLNIYNDNRQVISNTVLNALTNNARSSTELPSDIVIDVDSEAD